jgi:DNA-binding FadR family transcriptional regulator
MPETRGTVPGSRPDIVLVTAPDYRSAMARNLTREPGTGALLTAGPRAAVLTALSPVPGARDPKLAERIAAAIEGDVLRAGWPVGQAVGSEDQLADRYGVGRAVIREAIRLAEHRQVVRMRRGRGGGLRVVAPDVSAVTDSLAIFLQYARADVDDLIEARTVLEVFAATAAAAAPPDEMTAAAIAAAAADEPGCSDQPAGHSARELHYLVARTTGNAALLLFIQAIAALTDRLTGAGRTAALAVGGHPGAGQRQHVAIARAISRGEAAEAAELMRADMAAFHRAIKLAAQAGQREPELAALAPTGRAPLRPADLLAARIQREIIELGWPVGESLGFEADLLQRYGIGRAQFREAVRILENHSVVRMQRGAAGGMLVTAPDGRAVVRVTALYLTYQGMNTAHIRDLRAHLEAATLRLAIDRLTGEGVQRLEALLELERTWPDDDFRAVSHDLHAMIAELSGNRTLALLQSIVMQLTAERLHSGDPHRVTEPPDAVRRAHRAIVDAVIARDAPPALRRMEKHLRAVARWTTDRSASRG